MVVSKIHGVVVRKIHSTNDKGMEHTIKGALLIVRINSKNILRNLLCT